MTLALLLRIAIPPVLVALMSLAARRWGPTIGGLIMGLPWMTGPVLFFLALDKGTEFAVAACTGVELAVWGMSAFILTYAVASRWAPWPICIAAALSAYFATAHLTQTLSIPLLAAASGGALSLIACFLLLPKPKSAAVPGRLPWWDIPARMIATFCLVAVIMLSADRLGPRLSGIVASYPVILTVIGSFTHQQWGRDAVLRVLRGITLSLLAFVGYFVVIGYALPEYGLVSSFGLAAITAVAISAAFITWNNWRQLR